MRKQSAGHTIIFEIENIIEETNNGYVSYYKGTNKNRNDRGNENRRPAKRTVQQLSSTEFKTVHYNNN